MSEYRPRTPSPFPDDVRASFIGDAHATHDGCPNNPTKIDKPFWKYMISNGSMAAYTARHTFSLLLAAMGTKGAGRHLLFLPLQQDRDDAA